VSNGLIAAHVGRICNPSVNSLVPDLITIVPEPGQIDGNQQVLAKWA
jgi:hypothetical protein